MSCAQGKEKKFIKVAYNPLFITLITAGPTMLAFQGKADWDLVWHRSRLVILWDLLTESVSTLSHNENIVFPTRRHTSRDWLDRKG